MSSLHHVYSVRRWVLYFFRLCCFFSLAIWGVFHFFSTLHRHYLLPLLYFLASFSKRGMVGLFVLHHSSGKLSHNVKHKLSQIINYGANQTCHCATNSPLDFLPHLLLSSVCTISEMNKRQEN